MPQTNTRSHIRKWITRGFLIWATLVMLWLANSIRTKGVSQEMLQDSPQVQVESDAERLSFLPRNPKSAGIVFLCGSGVAAEAYVPLLRPLAEEGYPVVIERLPWRFAPLESHKRQACVQAWQDLQQPSAKLNHAEKTEHCSWIVSGHSLGAALACRVVKQAPGEVAAVVLIGTTHPKRDNLSNLQIPVTKIYATQDGVAPEKRIRQFESFLPAQTRWVKIEGGNHSQFAHYGPQLMDGWATISREDQQRQTRDVLRQSLLLAAKSTVR